jgi:hypothetical protein
MFVIESLDSHPVTNGGQVGRIGHGVLHTSQQESGMLPLATPHQIVLAILAENTGREQRVVEKLVKGMREGCTPP